MHPLLLTLSLVLQSPAAPSAKPAALRGLDPVELTRGLEIAGEATRSIEHAGQVYNFVTDENKQRFAAEPARFEIQLGGGCGRMGPLSGICNSARFAVHDARIYLFASDACRTAFLKSPERYLDHDDPPLDDAGLDRAAGRKLLDSMIVGLGGAERVDAVRTLRWTKLAQQESGGKIYATRESALYRLPDDLRHEHAWDASIWFDVDTRKDGFNGKNGGEALHEDARKELRRQLGREPLYLARQRTRADFDVAAAGTQTIGESVCDVLIVRLANARTSLCVERGTGRVLRAAWRGRLGTGALGEVVVETSDFRPVAGVVLPHVRQVNSDGVRVERLSGWLDALEVDVELADALFAR